jgi:hypothetical protein
MKTQENKYPVVCAWCKQKGKQTVVNSSTVKNSRGVCKPCSDYVMNTPKIERKHGALRCLLGAIILCSISWGIVGMVLYGFYLIRVPVCNFFFLN